MNIRGRRTLDAPRTAVFAAILDPSILLAVIPGCREIETTGEGEYHGEIALRLPGIVGTYQTVVRVVEAVEPSFGRLEGEVVGGLGSIRGQASFRLADDGGRTVVEYDGEAAIGGPLARLDSRFIEGLAGTMVSQGLANLNARLRAGASASASVSAAATAAAPARETTKETPG
jgi:carbon monoxide dehydrogenase subunit G